MQSSNITAQEVSAFDPDNILRNSTESLNGKKEKNLFCKYKVIYQFYSHLIEGQASSKSLSRTLLQTRNQLLLTELK